MFILQIYQDSDVINEINVQNEAEVDFLLSTHEPHSSSGLDAKHVSPDQTYCFKVFKLYGEDSVQKSSNNFFTVYAIKTSAETYQARLSL